MSEQEFILLPRKLTAENGAKKLLIGEFFEKTAVDCPDCPIAHGNNIYCDTCNDTGEISVDIPVSWTTIKAIYKKIIEYYGEAQRMSEQELMAFNAYWYIEARVQDEYLTAKYAWQACAEQKDKIIEQQATELAALRGFAKDLLINYAYQFIDCSDVYSAAKDNGILDENGNPTKLLTGESE